MHIELNGFCPTQGRNYSISVKMLDESSKLVGRTECDHVRHLGNCSESCCPIVKQNGYHH